MSCVLLGSKQSVCKGRRHSNLASSSSSAIPDHYAVLGIPHTASQAQIKQAYHRTLLRNHPDKLSPSHPSEHLSVSLIREAYATLSSPDARTRYDASAPTTGPRPAQVVSLDDLDEIVEETADGTGTSWQHPCRCGGTYKIGPKELEKDMHLVGCTSCSEVIWVGYEVVDEEEVSPGDSAHPDENGE